jgi:hypothetical protein
MAELQPEINKENTTRAEVAMQDQTDPRALQYQPPPSNGVAQARDLAVQTITSRKNRRATGIQDNRTV